METNLVYKEREIEKEAVRHSMLKGGSFSPFYQMNYLLLVTFENTLSVKATAIINYFVA